MPIDIETLISSAGAWGKRHLALLIGSAMAIGVAGFILTLAAKQSEMDIARANDPDLVVDEWRESLGKLGVKAVFPLREDFYVGDLYAYDADSSGSGQSSPRFNSMHVAHVDATDDALRKAYQSRPRFPPAPKDYDWISPVEVNTSIFAPPAAMTSLPIVAFPDISVTTASTASLTGAWSGIRAAIGAARSTSENVQIRFPEAETYGVPADVARTLLDTFCNPATGEKNSTCGQTRVRELLSSLIGGDVLCSRKPANGADTAATPEARPHRVGLVFVYRVYLTRSIDYGFGSDTSVAAEAQAARERADAAPPTPNGTDHSGADPLAPRENVTATIEHLSRSLGGIGQGGELSFASATGNGVVLRRKFARPLAFAYAAIVQEPIDDGCFGKPTIKETKLN